MNARGRHSSDAALLAAVASVALVLGLVWLWGGLAGVLFGRGWPPMTIGLLLHVLLALPSHLGNPASAWPPAARLDLPTTLELYATLAIVLTAAALAFHVFARGIARLTDSGAARRARGARWATGHDLRALSRRPLRRRGARIALGCRHGRMLYGERRHAVAVFGPPQSGKSAGLAVPALLDWPGPAIASSLKSDLLTASEARRRRLGGVYVFDPFQRSGKKSDTWSPLARADSWDRALECARRLGAAAELDQCAVGGGDHWALAAEQRLAPLLFTASRGGREIGTVVRWAYGQGTRELHDALALVAEQATDEQEMADAHAAYDALRTFEAQADRTRCSIEATAQALLRPYCFPKVARTARSSDISPERLLDQPATLYLIGDARASNLLRPIFLALLGEIVDYAYERASCGGGRLETPLLLCLDEAGSVAPLPNLAEIASTAPSHNIQLVSIFHDFAQARSRYGQQAETVVNSHRARLLLGGVADLHTLRYFAGLLGEEERMGRAALRQLPKGRALLLYGSLPPAQLRLRMWFEDRRLRGLAAT